MRVYFPGLNGIRFLAACLVIITHIEGFKNKAGLFNLFKVKWAETFIANAGPHGVKIFYTLSGFLITYLLLIEVSEKNTIDIGKFYIRRILRIWPLYFLIILLGFFILPHFFNPSYFSEKTHPDFISKLLLNIFFLPNAVLYFWGSIFSIGILWSIGIEEQFYIVWPHIIKKAIKTNLIKIVLVGLAIILTIKIGIYLSSNSFGPYWKERHMQFCSLFLQYDAMMIGSLFALLHFYHKTRFGFFMKKTNQIILIFITVLLFLFAPDLGIFTNLIFCSLYGMIILNISTNEHTFLKLQNPLLDFLGQVSFGGGF